MPKIKICGLTRLKDIEAVNIIKPDFIGFVFAPSKRQVTVEKARMLKERLDKNILSVGVFVNESPENIIALGKEHIIDMVQLHGDESEKEIIEIQKSLGIPIIKAVRVQSAEQITKAEQLPCDYLLLDAFVSGQYGGSGKRIDLTFIPSMKKPFFLAGGLTKENLSSVLLRCNPYAVDVSSGVETDGGKDREKMEAMVNIIRKS